MSAENVEIVKAIYRGWQEGDFSSADWADPEIEFTVPGPDRTVRGIEAMNRTWHEWLDVFEEMSIHPKEFHDSGDQVAVDQRFRGKGSGSGFPVDLPGAVLFTLRAGRVIRFEGYTTIDEALAALGDEH